MKEILNVIKSDIINKNKFRFCIIFFILIISISVSLITPLLERSLIDNGIVKLNLSIVIENVILIFGLNTLLQVLSMIQDYVQFLLEVDYKNNLSIKTINHAAKLRKTEISDHGLYKIVNDAQYDIEMISQLCGRQFLGLIIDVLQITGYLIGLMIINWRLGLILIGLMPIKFYIINLYSKKREKKSEDSLETRKNISNWFGDFFDGIFEIKLWNLYDRFIKNYSDKLTELKNNRRKIVILDLQSNFIERLLEYIFSLITYILGTYWIIKGDLSIGGLFTFITFASNFTGAIDIFSRIKMSLADIKPSFKSYNKFMSLPEEQPLVNDNFTLELDEIKKISFENVEFKIDNKSILKSINLSFKEGEKVAIVGENGSGKSSIINCLLRFYEIASGSIFLNDININRIELNTYRNIFKVMTQDVYLFNTSIKENILLNLQKQNIDDHILKFLNFTKKMPRGMGTRVGKGGSKLSGGERQRVALARALSKEAPILLLDEATSNCDYNSEIYIRDIIKNENFKILIAITHDYDQLSYFDKIIVIKKGQVIAEGAFEEVKKYLN